MVTLEQLWKCLENDAVFSCYQKRVAKNWVLLPSTSQQLYSTSSDILPVIYPTVASDEESYNDDEFSAFDLLSRLNMPILDSSVSHTVRSFCRSLSNYRLV